MAVIDGCREGKNTPKLEEVKCPKCGADMEVFAYMNGTAGVTGRTVSDEKCPVCGYVIPENTPVADLT